VDATNITYLISGLALGISMANIVVTLMINRH